MTAPAGSLLTGPSALLLPALSDPPRLRCVAPDDVPPGAFVVAVVVADVADTDPQADTAPQLAPTSPARLIALPAVAKGVDEIRPGLVHDGRGRRVLVDGVEVALTRREYELFAHLVAHPGRVFTRSQLLNAVWDLDPVGYAPARTVDVHVARLRRKVGPHAQALHSIRGVGYRWNGGV